MPLLTLNGAKAEWTRATGTPLVDLLTKEVLSCTFAGTYTPTPNMATSHVKCPPPPQ